MKRIEAYKAFPIVAWLLILSFSCYVYLLVATTQDERSILSEQTATTEQALKDPTSI